MDKRTCGESLPQVKAPTIRSETQVKDEKKEVLKWYEYEK